MSDAAETKPDPTTQAPEEQKPETTATGEGEKSVTETAVDTAKEVAEGAKDAAVKTSDTVFSMFGGGPKKEKKDEPEEATDEPSGSSKAQKEGEVSSSHISYAGDLGSGPGVYRLRSTHGGGGVVFFSLVPASCVVATTPLRHWADFSELFWPIY